MAYGALTTALTGVPDNVDLAKLRMYQTSDGVTWDILMAGFREMARAFGAFDWPNHPELAGAMRATVNPSTDDRIRFRIGNLAVSAADPDYLGQPTAQHRTRAGAQVPTRRRDSALGYTWSTMRPGPEALSSDEVLGDFASWRDAYIDELRVEWLKSIGLEADRPVQTSNTGTCPGWVGGNQQDYVPPMYQGHVFTSSHSHYYGDGASFADSEAGRRSLFDTAWKGFLEHGIRSTPAAPIIMFHGDATIGDVQADASATGGQYVYGGTPGVNLGTTATTVDLPPYAHGKFKDSGIVCCQMPGIPDNYYVWVKSYGLLNARNPVRLWYPTDIGFGLTAIDMDVNTPMTREVISTFRAICEFGFGVTAPENGAVGEIGSSSSWTDPVIT